MKSRKLRNVKIYAIVATLLSICGISTAQGQDTTKLLFDNNITSIYTKTDQAKLISLNFSGENSIFSKRMSLQSTTNYSLTISNGIAGNELTQNLTAIYRKINFITGTYGHSLYREQQAGTIGIGRYLIKKNSLSISYAAIYERVDLFDSKRTEKLRHSIKVGMSAKKGLIEAATNIYYQPNMSNPKDYVLYGVSKVSFSPNGRLSFVTQSIFDYRSKNEIRLINNITLGIGYTFRN